MQIRQGDRVLFSDEHAQVVDSVDLHLDEVIVWLRCVKPLDPSWVLLSELVYYPEGKYWLYQAEHPTAGGSRSYDERY